MSVGTLKTCNMHHEWYIEFNLSKGIFFCPSAIRHVGNHFKLNCASYWSLVLSGWEAHEMNHALSSSLLSLSFVYQARQLAIWRTVQPRTSETLKDTKKRTEKGTKSLIAGFLSRVCEFLWVIRIALGIAPWTPTALDSFPLGVNLYESVSRVLCIVCCGVVRLLCVILQFEVHTLYT